jgi:hypothetical protein
VRCGVAGCVRGGLQSALFSFTSLIQVLLLFICTAAYLRPKVKFIDNHKKGFSGIVWKAARIGERLSPWVSVACILMAVHVLYAS